MPSLNRVQLIGHLGRDPETRHTANGTAVCNFTLATNERRKLPNGEWGDETTWHRIVAWDKLAELCEQYLSRGRLVYIEGRIQIRKYTDRDGNERQSGEIVAREVLFLSGKGEDAGTERHASRPQASRPTVDPVIAAIDEDLPF